MSYLVCHMEKYTKNEVSPVEEENERDEEYQASNPQIDSERTHQNYHVYSPVGPYIKTINYKLDKLNLSRKIRSDAIYMNSFVVGSDNEFFKNLSMLQQRQFFHDCADFFVLKYGRDNILSAVVNVDETTPHMHLNMVPITNGKLCSKDLFDKRKLSILQSEFYEYVGEKYGLERGKEGSQAKHLSTAEFKAKKIIEKAQEEAEKINSETDKQRQIIEEAKATKLTKNKNKLQEQITALLSENKSLVKRLDTSMKETLEFAQENKKLQGQVETLSKMAKVGLEVSKSYPTIYREITSPQEPIKRNDYFNGNSK